MKILIITPIYPGYSDETRRTSPFAIHYFATEWVKQGHEVEVVRIWPYRPFPFSLFMDRQKQRYAYSESFVKDNVTVHRLPIKKMPIINFQQRHIKHSISQVQKQVIEFNPEIIICHSISPAYFIGCALGVEFQIPVFLTVHKTDITYLSNEKNLKRFKMYYPNSSRVFFRSFALKREYSNIMKEKQIGDIVLSGIDKKEIIDIEEIHKKSKVRSINFIVACNLDNNKRVDTIIKAIQRIPFKSQVNLKVIGDGPERSKLEKYVKENNMESIVKFSGEQSRKEVLKSMQAADVFVMVSASETFGLVYIEAMSKGCLVIGSRGQGIDGVIRHGENGFLCEVDNVEELSGIIEHCINLSENEKRNILIESYKTVSNLTLEKSAEEYLNAIKKYIDNQ